MEVGQAACRIEVENSACKMEMGQGACIIKVENSACKIEVGQGVCRIGAILDSYNYSMSTSLNRRRRTAEEL